MKPRVLCSTVIKKVDVLYEKVNPVGQYVFNDIMSTFIVKLPMGTLNDCMTPGASLVE
jgi:hypothetical protein